MFESTGVKRWKLDSLEIESLFYKLVLLLDLPVCIVMGSSAILRVTFRTHSNTHLDMNRLFVILFTCYRAAYLDYIC